MAALLLLIQLIPVDHTNPPVQSRLPAPTEISNLLRRACFDCHSHETRWPWYSRVAPVSWVVAGHVRTGRRDLNFSRWPVFDFQQQELIMREMEKQLTAGTMPPRSYRLGHPEARLNQGEREILLAWIRKGFAGSPLN